MRDKLDKILKAIFSIFLIIAILGGGVVFAMFVIALIIGGEMATNLATSAQKAVMPYFIKSAAIAVLAGLISLYNSQTHTLSLKEEEVIADTVSEVNTISEADATSEVDDISN